MYAVLCVCVLFECVCVHVGVCTYSVCVCMYSAYMRVYTCIYVYVLCMYECVQVHLCAHVLVCVPVIQETGVIFAEDSDPI